MSQVQKVLQEPVTRILRRGGMRDMWLKFEVQIHNGCWENVLILTYHLMELCAATIKFIKSTQMTQRHQLDLPIVHTDFVVSSAPLFGIFLAPNII